MLYARRKDKHLCLQRRQLCTGKLQRKTRARTFAGRDSILNGESEKYLSEELKNKGSALKNYLGEFTDVALPTEAAISKYGGDAVGLVYPRGGGLFEVKYFIAEQKDGKVTNIYPADEE